MKKILVTGGAGFIGSHTLVLILNKGYDVVVIDNLCNSVQIAPGESKPQSILRVEKLTGRSCQYEKVDIADLSQMRRIFKENGFDCVMHFAALKSVGESVRSPLKYYENNVTGGINLLQMMTEFGVKKLIFSSSSTVYGNPAYLPVDEDHSTGNCVSPYGRTKFITEQMMRDLCNSDKEWKAIMLRYFNPIGAHPSGEIGEDPPGVPRNLIPYMSQIAVGRRKCLSIFGNDYNTPDGTGIRGYIHVMDLAAGHLSALEKLISSEFGGWKAYNLGKGGHSVLQVVAAFEKASGVKIPYEFVPRRPGDVAATFTDSSLAEKELGWTAERDLDEMCEDSWRFQSKNPDGYANNLKCKNGDTNKSESLESAY